MELSHSNLMADQSLVRTMRKFLNILSGKAGYYFVLVIIRLFLLQWQIYNFFCDYINNVAILSCHHCHHRLALVEATERGKLLQ